MPDKAVRKNAADISAQSVRIRVLRYIVCIPVYQGDEQKSRTSPVVRLILCLDFLGNYDNIEVWQDTCHIMTMLTNKRCNMATNGAPKGYMWGFAPLPTRAFCP